MRKLFYLDHKPRCTLWDSMWSTRTIKQELEACDIETAPRVIFLNLIPKNGRIIDAGCGFGKWVIYLSKKSYNVIGVDNNDLALSKLREFDNSLVVESGDIQNLKYSDNFFDAYISMGVVEHFEEGPIVVLKEAYRIIKPNGLIFVSTPTVNIIRKILVQPLLNIINRFYNQFNAIIEFFRNSRSLNLKTSIQKKSKREKKYYYHFIEYRFSPKELQSFLQRTNFEVIKTVPHDFHDSKNHHIGLGVDFPFLKKRNSVNFELNVFGKIIARIFDYMSPWIACASVLCVGKSLKKN